MLSLIDDIMTDEDVAFMVLTETNIAEARVPALRAAMRERGMWYRRSKMTEAARRAAGGGSSGTGVLVMWRAGLGLTPTHTEEHDRGRGVSVRFKMKGGSSLQLIGLYGVSSPEANRGAADDVWRWTQGQLSKHAVWTRRRGEHPKSIVGGDMNAVMDPTTERGAIQGPRREGADPGLAGFLRNSEVCDVADCWGGGNQAVARAFTFRARHGGGGVSRIDKFYVTEALRGGVVESGGRAREPHMLYADAEGQHYVTDHGLAWMTLSGEVVGGRGPCIRGASEGRPFRSSGGEYSRHGGNGYPVMLSGGETPEGVEDGATVGGALAWMKAGGYKTDQLEVSARVRDKEGAAKLVDAWVSSGMAAGVLSEAGRGQGIREEREPQVMAGEMWVPFSTMEWAAHARERGKGWAAMTTADGGTHDVRVERVGQVVRVVLRARTETAGCTRAELLEYLHEAHVPRCAVAHPGKSDDTHVSWVVDMEDWRGVRWMESYGTPVKGWEGWGVDWAAGKRRYRAEVKTAVPEEGVSASALEAIMEKAATRAFGRPNAEAVGRKRGGGDRVTLDLESALRCLRLGVDPGSSHRARARAHKRIYSEGLAQQCRDCVRGHAIPGGRGHQAAVALLAKAQGELNRRRRSAVRIEKNRYRAMLEELYSSDIKGWLGRMLGTTRGGAGAAAARDENGEVIAGTAEEALVEMRGEYVDWFRNGTTGVPADAQWWEELFGPQEWASEEIYGPLTTPVTHKEVKAALTKAGGKAPGPSGVTREMWLVMFESHPEQVLGVMNRVMTTGEFDEGMLAGLLYPTPKKAGPTVKANARPIALLEVITKCLTRVLATRWQDVLRKHPVLERSQMAFVPGCDIWDNIETDSFLWEWCRANDHPLHVAYLDCSKAYESVAPWLTRAALKAHKVPEGFVEMIVKMDEVPGGRRVITEFGLTAVLTFAGMAQGEVLSPIKFVYSQDPLVRWLSKYGRGVKVRMMIEGVERVVEVVSLHFCDDMNIYGGSREDLQHNLGIVAEYARVTGLQLNGEKSAYLTTEAVEGVLPVEPVTMAGVWRGGCDGGFEADDGDAAKKISPKAWDEAVRTLGVWRSITGELTAQTEVLEGKVGAMSGRLAGKRVGLAEAKFVVNGVLIPRLTYPLRDAGQGGVGGRVIKALDTKVRTFFKSLTGLARGTSNAYLYLSEKAGGMGLARIRDIVDGDIMERAHRGLLTPWAREYWARRGAQLPAGSLGREEATRRATQAGLAHDAMCMLTLEMGAAKGTPQGESPYNGINTPAQWRGRRAGILDERLAARGWALERRGEVGVWDGPVEAGDAEIQDIALWRLMPAEEAECVLEIMTANGIRGLRDVMTRDGGRLKGWRRLQREGLAPSGDGEARWYEVLRRGACVGRSYVLKERFRGPPRPLLLGDVVCVPFAGSEAAGEGAHRMGVVRALEGGRATVEPWDRRTLEDGSDDPVYRPVVGEEWSEHPAEWCCWMEAHVFDGQDAMTVADWADEEGIEYMRRWGSREDEDDTDSDESDEGEGDGPEDGAAKGVPELGSTYISDGSFYPPVGEDGGLAGWAAAQWKKDSDGVWSRLVCRGTINNGGVPAWMASGIDAAEAMGLLAMVRMHREHGDVTPATLRVDCTSLISIWDKLDTYTERDWVRLPNRATWREIKRLRDMPGGALTLVHSKSHIGLPDEALVDRHAKCIARRSGGVRTVEDYPRGDAGDIEFFLVDRVGGPIPMGAKAAVKRVAAEGYAAELRAQEGQGYRLRTLWDAGSRGAALKGDRFRRRLMTSGLPTGRQNAWRYPNLYDSDVCLMCGEEPETNRHWRYHCQGEAGQHGARARIAREAEELVIAALGPKGVAAAWGVTRATETSRPWEGRGKVLVHMPERRWVVEGKKKGVYTVRDPMGVAPDQRLRSEAYWKLRSWWSGAWDDGGVAFVTDLRKGLAALVAEVVQGTHERRQSMCWASDETFADIVVDVGDVVGEAFGDLRNLCDRYEWGCTLEGVLGFYGPGEDPDEGRVRQNGLRTEVWVEMRVNGNPEFNVRDVSSGGHDMVVQAIELAKTSEFSLLEFPLFAGCGYEGRVRSAGGVIVFQAPPDSWSFVPDAYWHGGSEKNRKGYLPDHVMAVVALGRRVRNGRENGRIERLKDHIEAWWAGRAPEALAVAYLARRRDGGKALPQWMRWWDPEREVQLGWGWGRDVRSTEGAYHQASMWEGEMGGMGWAPPSFKTVLVDLGVEPAEAKRASGELVAMLRAGTKDMWELRCHAQRKEEGARGITDDMKRDNGDAAEWRAAHRGRLRQRRRVRPGLGEDDEYSSEDDITDDEEMEGWNREEVERSDIGVVVSRTCSRGHRTEGRERRCGQCDRKLPARVRTWPVMTVQRRYDRRGEREYWETTADMGVREGDDSWAEMGWEARARVGGMNVNAVRGMRLRVSGRTRRAAAAEVARARAAARADAQERADDGERAAIAAAAAVREAARAAAATAAAADAEARAGAARARMVDAGGGRVAPAPKRRRGEVRRRRGLSTVFSDDSE